VAEDRQLSCGGQFEKDPICAGVLRHVPAARLLRALERSNFVDRRIARSSMSTSIDMLAATELHRRHHLQANMSTAARCRVALPDAGVSTMIRSKPAILAGRITTSAAPRRPRVQRTTASPGDRNEDADHQCSDVDYILSMRMRSPNDQRAPAAPARRSIDRTANPTSIHC